MKSRDKKVNYYLTPSGTWRVRFYCENNKVQNRVCKTKTERDALVRAIKNREELDYWFPEDSGTDTPILIKDFKSLSELWIDHSRNVREISESCLMNYQGHLNNHILSVLGDKVLKEIKLRDIEELASKLKQKKPRTKPYQAIRKSRLDEDYFEDDEFLSQSYRKEILTVACMITKFGFERSYLVSNPFREFVLPKLPDLPYDYWRLEDEDKFLQWLEDGGMVEKKVMRPHSLKNGKPEYFLKRFRTRNVQNIYDIVLFALRSGLRKGEIGALTRRDVVFSKNYLIVRRSFSEKENRLKKTTKGKTYRIIEMNDDMVEILKRRVEKAKSDKDFLFNTRAWAIKNFSKYCIKAGVREIHFHSLRHTCLTNLANGYGMQKPLPLPQVQKIAGHRDIATTMRYVHTDGIENTCSMQLSRSQRKQQLNAQKSDKDSGSFGKLRLISNN